MFAKIETVLLAVLLFVASCRCPDCTAQQPKTSPKEKPPVPQVDTAEIYRRGDMVVIAGEGPRAASDEAMRLATSPPPDDSYMWFITVIKTANCQYCEKLLSDFQKAPELLAFVAAAEPYKPWGHFNVYNAQDSTQTWRVKEYKITGYPTLVIQPPRNGMWGSPRTVVWQKTGYDGNPKKLSQEIGTAVRKYAAKMSEQGYPKIQSGGSEATAQKHSVIGGRRSLEAQANLHFPEVVGGSRQDHLPIAGAGQAPTGPPPFPSPPRVDPFNPIPGPNQPTPNGTWPPTDQPTVNPLPSAGLLVTLITQLIGALTGSQTLTNIGILILVILRVLERTAPVTKTTLDDRAVVLLNQLLTVLKTSQPVVVTPVNQPVQVTPTTG